MPDRRPARPDAARVAAFEVVRAVAESDAYANLVLPARVRAHGLHGRDAAFATELAAGTLRRLGTYDAVVAHCARRPVDRLDPPVLAVLRLGVHQALAMRVPPHAAVATSVTLARAVAGARVAGLVNAVLRRATERTLGEWVAELAPDPDEDPLGYAALAYAHPRWVVAALEQALGARADELAELLTADNVAPSVTLVARPGLATRQELLTSGATPTAYSPWGVELSEGDPARVPAVAEGRAGVQDEGSQLVTRGLLAAPLSGPDHRWLDLCAGPGGKAALLGAVAAERGARVLAVERQPHRAQLVRRSVRALPTGTVGVVAGDGTRPAWQEACFDRVLVDAPCTGLGAVRRRPEARWRRTPDDLADLVVLQRRLLAGALAAVRPGGVVGYVTCSPLLEETAGVVQAVLAERDDLTLLDAREALPVPDAEGPLPGTVQTWPHRHGTDAMFLALLRRA